MRVKQTIKKIFEITLGALFVVVGISQAFGMGRHAFVFSILRKAPFEIPFINYCRFCTEKINAENRINHLKR